MSKKLFYPYGIVVVIILFGSYQRLPALMPPHFYDSIPEYGGNLLGETVWLFGYSIGLDPEDVQVMDLTTDSVVKVAFDLDCATEGEGDMPGCMQTKCTLAVTLNEPAAGHEYEMTIDRSYFDDQYRFFRFISSADDPGQDRDLDGFTDNQGDCNDDDAQIYPGAVERCSDTVDRDCDGVYSVCCRSDSSGSGSGCLILSVQ